MVGGRVIALAAAFTVIPVGFDGGSNRASADKYAGEGRALAAPAVMPNRSKIPRTVEVSLIAETARISLKPGPPTEVFAYNGTVPGPTLEVNEGDRVIVHFENRLTVPTTVHWHGLHIPFVSDGSPFHPVAPGGKRVYSFTLQPGSAGTYWYHPHPGHGTSYQIAKGLYGGIIVRAPDDPLPASLPEKLLLLVDNRFAEDGSIDIPSMHASTSQVDEENGREGDVLFVNGQISPVIAIRSGEVQRWRVINASASRVYRLSISGHTMLHVGSDGGLFERPVELKEITIANGERVELLVRGTGKPGDRTSLQALPYDRYIPQTRPRNWNTTLDLASLQYAHAKPVAPPSLPARLRPVPPLDSSQATATRVVVLSQGMINGQTMDMNRVDFSTKLDATEIWEIENIVGMDHPFHLHGFQFQVLSRNGVPEPYRSWKDLINVPKHETARIIVRYGDFRGKWMFHCHIFSHEDKGMMGILEVK